jgi:hypothetical protein
MCESRSAYSRLKDGVAVLAYDPDWEPVTGMDRAQMKTWTQI